MVHVAMSDAINSVQGRYTRYIATIPSAPSASADAAAARRILIQPYPSQLERRVSLPDGRNILLRPIRPEDAQSEQARVVGGNTPGPRRVRWRCVTFGDLLQEEQQTQYTESNYRDAILKLERERLVTVYPPAEKVVYQFDFFSWYASTIATMSLISHRRLSTPAAMAGEQRSVLWMRAKL